MGVSLFHDLRISRKIEPAAHAQFHRQNQRLRVGKEVGGIGVEKSLSLYICLFTSRNSHFVENLRH